MAKQPKRPRTPRREPSQTDPAEYRRQLVKHLRADARFHADDIAERLLDVMSGSVRVFRQYDTQPRDAARKLCDVAAEIAMTGLPAAWAVIDMLEEFVGKVGGRPGQSGGELVAESRLALARAQIGVARRFFPKPPPGGQEGVEQLSVENLGGKAVLEAAGLESADVRPNAAGGQP